MADGLPQYAPTTVDVTAAPDQVQPVDTSGQMIQPEQAPQWQPSDLPQWQAAIPSLTTTPAFDPALHAAAVSHSRAANVLNEMGKAILGGNATAYRLQKNDDGSVDVQPYEMSMGQKWGRIAAAALGGAAKGFAVGTGPGGAGRAAGAGLDVGMQVGQGNQQQALDIAQKMNQQNRDQQTFKANLALLNQSIMRNTWLMHHQTMQDIEGEQDRQAKINAAMRANHATPIVINSNGDPHELMARVADKINTDPELAQAHADGLTDVYTNFGNDGNVTGATIWKSPVDKRNQLNTAEIPQSHLAMSDDGSKLINVQDDPIPAGYMTMDEARAAKQAQEDRDGKTRLAFFEHAGQALQTQTALRQAQAAEAEARAATAGAAAANKETFQPMTIQNPDGSTTYVEHGSRGTWKAPEGPAADLLRAQGATVSKLGAGGAANQKAELALDKTYIKPARDAEKANLLFNQAYAERARENTGAQSMLALSQHLATTFGNVKGSRITKDMIAEHLGARSITDDAKVAIQRLTTGDVLSPKQWNAFRELIGSARNSAWQEMSDAAIGMHLDPNTYLPADLKGTAVARGYQGPVTVPGTPTPGAGAAAPGANIGAAARAPAVAPVNRGNVSMAQAMRLPQNQGKQQTQVMDELRRLGYTPVP